MFLFFQSNKAPLPSDPFPYISSFKAVLTYADLESLRSQGPMFLRRGTEMNLETDPRAEIYPVGPGAQEDSELPPEGRQFLRVIISKPRSEEDVLYEFSRIGRAISGTPVEVTGSRVSHSTSFLARLQKFQSLQMVLLADEFSSLLDLVDEIFVEGCRLACTRWTPFLLYPS